MEDSPSDYPSDIIYTQEPLSGYKFGGYLPVHLGDTFKDGRYTIHHKLGWGGYSTLWLAHDIQKNRWVSLKIKTADTSQSSQELPNLEQLEKLAAPHGLGSRYICHLLDAFIHYGPNGIHQCLVFEMIGPTVDRIISDYRELSDSLDPQTILKLSKQLLKAVEFAHAAGVGQLDISGRNIVFAGKSLSYVSESIIFAVFGSPEHEPVTRLDGTPLHKGFPPSLIKPVNWEDWLEEFHEDIRILDLGEGFFQEEIAPQLAQPGPARVPELIFTETSDYRADLWRTGCMLFFFVFGTYPFQSEVDDEVLVAEMVDLLGDLPEEWQPTWDDMQETFEEGMDFQGDEILDLEGLFNKEINEPDLAPLVPVIRGLLGFLPSERITASEALDLLGSEDEDQFN
ncbi:kinase-like protein [Aspergillus sclerotioniger CBS 115572]|uniref:non-specific serine/threonine protein kinase n=1 Tax=Aspergillus sclerotioniger CBS 115572 TaxID=1450535 RepID=A0A317WAL2_9EURO|nr:kinase-like protein [Aspergillus sclerotioniger CBS 115572]PWY83239.1 kinase-like protein [Aspergillus sclerotioniger CBS 115572]